jgi:hypothetical protein
MVDVGEGAQGHRREHVQLHRSNRNGNLIVDHVHVEPGALSIERVKLVVRDDEEREAWLRWFVPRAAWPVVGAMYPIFGRGDVPELERMQRGDHDCDQRCGKHQAIHELRPVRARAQLCVEGPRLPQRPRGPWQEPCEHQPEKGRDLAPLMPRHAEHQRDPGESEGCWDQKAPPVRWATRPSGEAVDGHRTNHGDDEHAYDLQPKKRPPPDDEREPSKERLEVSCTPVELNHQTREESVNEPLCILAYGQQEHRDAGIGEAEGQRVGSNEAHPREYQRLENVLGLAGARVIALQERSSDPRHRYDAQGPDPLHLPGLRGRARGRVGHQHRT